MKISRQIKRQHGGSGGGFTLIEVVLVLAIGGLIFLLAFLAFGQATKNRRDTQRRSDAARMVSEIENAKGDANGSTFTDQDTLGNFVRDYLSGTKTAAAGGAPASASFSTNNITYSVLYNTDFPASTAASTSGTATIVASQGRICNGNGMSNATGNPGDYAVLVKLEKGVSCKDNK